MTEHPLAAHRAHDYRALIREWQALVKGSGLRMKSFAKVAGLPVFWVKSPEPKGDTRPTVYISAGVHGDEPAAPWGLLEWAKENVGLLEAGRFLMFPVLNPHGLTLNTRADLEGVDLNRAFNAVGHPLIEAWREVVAPHKLALALCLHEDYDGQGSYLYELNPRSPVVGHKILAECEGVLPVDRRRRIDGRLAKDGLIVRRLAPELPGHPEAIVLHLTGAPLTLTFESPSEFALHDRIEVQKTFIRSALRHGLSASA